MQMRHEGYCECRSVKFGCLLPEEDEQFIPGVVDQLFGFGADIDDGEEIRQLLRRREDRGIVEDLVVNKAGFDGRLSCAAPRCSPN